MNLFQKVAKWFETPPGQVKDMGGVEYPANESLRGEISPIPSHIPGVEFGIGLPMFGPAVLGYEVRLEDESGVQRGTISEVGREQLLADFEEQIRTHGKITRFPDLSGLDNSPPQSHLF